MNLFQNLGEIFRDILLFHFGGEGSSGDLGKHLGDFIWPDLSKYSQVLFSGFLRTWGV